MRKPLICLFLCFFAAFTALAELPEPPEDVPEVLIGEEHGDMTVTARLFYVSAGGSELTDVTRDIDVPAGADPLLCVLDELLAPSGSSELISVAPGETRVLSVETCGGFVTVNLSLDAAAVQSEAEILMMYTAIANTLAGLDGIEHVNVLIASRQEQVASLPTGVLSENRTGATALWAQYQAEAEHALDAGASAPIERSAALYFPSVNAQRVVPEVRTLSFAGGDYASALLDALIAGTDDSVCVSFLADIDNVLTAPPLMFVDSSGERVLDIYFTRAAFDTALLRGVEQWQIAASLALTMTSFIPELDCVCVYVDGEALTELNIRGEVTPLKNARVYREDVSPHIGAVADIYLADGEGLVKLRRVMSISRVRSPYSLLMQLISGPAPGEPYTSAFPEGVSASDLLGVRVSEGVATVNLSANFYRLCQTLPPRGEMQAVYSIVNTLCGLSGIDAVKIKIEGRAVETLSNAIYLKSPLMYNPGIVK